MIWNEELKDLYITQEITEFVHIEKKPLVCRSKLLDGLNIWYLY